VLDVQQGTHIKSLPGFREPQGIAAVPDATLIAVANGQGAGVQTIDPKDYQDVRSISLGDDSDNVRYDAAAKRLYVGYGSGALAAISPVDGKVLGSVKLAGHPESFQLEGAGPRIFVNVPTADHIAVVDRTSMKVIGTWPVSGAKANYPMALDEVNHRIFVGSAGRQRFWSTTRRPVERSAAATLFGDTDDLFYDPNRKRLYVTGGEGFTDVLAARTPAKLTRLARLTSAQGARTSLFIPERSRLYLAVPHRGAQQAAIRDYKIRD